VNNDSTEDIKQIKNSRKIVYIAIAAVVIIGLGIAALTGVFGDLTEPEEAAENGEIVATVNGEEITGAEFNQVLEQQKMQYEMQQGVDLDSEEMADMLSDLKEHVFEQHFAVPILLEQKAKEMDIDVSEEEIEERYQEYATQFGGEEALKEQMATVDITRDELDQDIIRELTIHSYIEGYLEEYLDDNPEEQIDQEDIEVGKEELENQYQQVLSQYDQVSGMLEEEDPDMPREQLEMQLSQLEEQYGYILEAESFEEIKEDLEKEMIEDRVTRERQQKETEILMEHIDELLKESEIETNF